MSQSDLHFHYVCTHEEACDLIEQHDRFWLSNCECREQRGGCKRSRVDVCLQFSEQTTVMGSGKRIASKPEVMEVLMEAKDKGLVARPFRQKGDYSITEGICFCCDDCCGYFLNPEDRCDKGAYIEKTDLEVCTHCGTCEQACFFQAREVVNDELVINSEACYGCGLCVAVCPNGSVEMVGRN